MLCLYQTVPLACGYKNNIHFNDLLFDSSIVHGNHAVNTLFLVFRLLNKVKTPILPTLKMYLERIDFFVKIANLHFLIMFYQHIQYVLLVDRTILKCTYIYHIYCKENW